MPGLQSLRTVVMTDVESFTELMRANEPQTLPLLKADMEVIRAHIYRHDGEVIKVAGDGLLALFSSAPSAVRACIDAQSELQGSTLNHRMAIHAGEVTVSGGDAYGDAVNFCARLESATIPGTVSASKIVMDLIRSQDLPTPHRNGKVQMKGVEGLTEVFWWGSTDLSKKNPRMVKRGAGYLIGAAIVLVLILGGIWLNSPKPIVSSRGKTLPRLQSTGLRQLRQSDPVAATADEILDQAYDEMWQEKETYDRVKVQAISELNPQLVVNWLTANPLGQRDRGRLEIEHWSLVTSAMNQGKAIVGDKATINQIIAALKAKRDKNLEIATKALIEEFSKAE